MSSKSADSSEFASNPPLPAPAAAVMAADAYIESCAADLMLRAGRETKAHPRRFYRAAATALHKVRRYYMAGVVVATAPGEAEDQGGVQ